MHIKQITISNFRSFRQQPEIHPFAPTTNCVVGRNGSGKSNLFDAIQFVLLGPRFATLRTEERQALLHEGSGSAAVTAFVEVVFDNSDQRFSLEHSDEVVLRRTVGAKKDEFFLQRKRATKQEVQSLLEGAGFSKSNPYFMVQQGKIQTLCVMTDTQRLELLQQVAGTTVYQDKKAESLVKMEENAKSMDKIQTILADLDQRLNDLQGEKEELTLYQQCDRTRRALEYTLYDKELHKARHVLDHLEHERAHHLQASAHWHEVAKQTHDQIQAAETHLQQQGQALKRNRQLWRNFEEDKTNAVTQQTKLNLRCQELQEQVLLGEETLKQTQQELQQLEQTIQQAQQELEQKDKTAKDEHAVLQQLLQQKDQASRQMDALYAKQGRGKEYSSKDERDRALRVQIQELQAMQQEKEQLLASQQDTLANLRRQQTEREQSIQNKQQELDTQTTSLQALHKSVEEKTRSHYALMDLRKHSWRQAETLQDQLKQARENQFQLVGSFFKTMPRATAMGIRALPRLVQQEGLVHGQQYFGMVLDNLHLKDTKFRTAVEAAAQNALFHVIVDSDATAARLMMRLEREKLGRVTFMPLNQIRVDPNTRYPSSNDVQPLLDTCIEYDRKVSLAMKQVFDKKLIARNTEIAAEWAEKIHMDCITLDGDLCSRKGALTGGYTDHSRSRLAAHAAKSKAEEEFRQLERNFRDADTKAKKAEQDVTNAYQEVSRLQHQQSQLNRTVASLETELTQQREQWNHGKKQAERILSQVIPPMEREIASITGDISRLQEEIGTELASALSDQDRADLATLKNQTQSLQDQISEQTERVEDARGQVQQVESLLEDNLLKRRRELTQVHHEEEGVAATTSTLQQEQLQNELEDRKQHLTRLTRDVADIDEKLENCRQSDEKIKAELRAAKNELEKLKGLDMKNSKKLDEASERSESLMSKKSMNIAKRDSYMRKIQELGSLPPPSELQKYKDNSIADLEKELDKVNKKLKKYSHVNKKAFDQYVNFSEQREALLIRKEELDQGAEKVRELVESLDRKKDEAINRTFRGVSKHFAEVFKELVPLGAGELIMRTALDEEPEGSQGDSSAKGKLADLDNPDVSLYRGIGINVRFSEVGENFLMNQLSGGQKALVALALIFAIQRCDPAPFYIFDELDQALDTSYRQAVANVIQKQASNPDSPTQFITSTFRPELVAIARNCYGISHQNKVSSVHHMSKNDALKFIANLMSEEEAVPDEISAVRSKSSRKRKSVDTIEEGDDGEPVVGPAEIAA
eukprot:Nitzschia sp. Nitz4//scaffold6_size259037//88180//92167//NITZ4_001062-RA/size259037-augustus-gene-0.319-mRNA-1//-1//CDS//3329556857//4587//frame0